MKPTAVHLHLYYTQRWPEIRKYLEHLDAGEYHLYVTLSQENAPLAQAIKAFHPQSTVWQTPNRGYDVGPFMDFLQKVDLSRYDLILKIHTKNKSGLQKTWINGRCITKKRWVDLLMNALLGSADIWRRNLEAFAADPRLGMISSRYLITQEPECSDYLRPEIERVLKQMGLCVPDKITFAAGTMFLVRARLLEKIKQSFTAADFPPTDASVQDGTLAHVFERVFGCVVEAQGYAVKGFDKRRWFEMQAKLYRVSRFFYSNDITRSNHQLIKICKIPVYYKNLNHHPRGS